MTEFRSWVEVEVAVLSSPSPIVLKVSVDVKQHCTELKQFDAELRKCVLVLVASVDTKQH